MLPVILILGGVALLASSCTGTKEEPEAPKAEEKEKLQPASPYSKEAQKAWDGWKKRFIIDLPEGSIVIDKQNIRAPEEGMGYGMYLSTRFDDEDTFNRLESGLDNYFTKQNGLFYWCLTMSGQVHPRTNNVLHPHTSSADADIYLAAAFKNAADLSNASRWKPGKGEERLRKAQGIVNSIWENDVFKGGRLIIKPSDGPWPLWGDGHVVYNPSYFTPHFLREFSEIDKNKGHDWQKVIDDGYDLHFTILSNTTALYPSGQNPIPDWVLVKVENYMFKVKSYNHIVRDNEFDAIRVPVEIGKDAIFNNEIKAIGFLGGLLSLAGVSSEAEAKIHGEATTLSRSCYGIAVEAIGDPMNILPGFKGAITSSFQEDYFGFSPEDANDYYGQSTILLTITR